ncbi:MAG: hypothetical protein K8U57_39050 [Planctomycetes bacterium]|nr:hypothetical protein [Planctomycetota bacterium]
MRSLPPHADVIPALERLRDADYRLFTLTNSSKAAVADQMEYAGLTGFFEALLSVEDGGSTSRTPTCTAGRRAGSGPKCRSACWSQPTGGTWRVRRGPG